MSVTKKPRPTDSARGNLPTEFWTSFQGLIDKKNYATRPEAEWQALAQNLWQSISTGQDSIAPPQSAWRGKLQQAIAKSMPPAAAQKYTNAFPMSYQENVTPAQAVQDAVAIENFLTSGKSAALHFSRRDGADADSLHVSLYQKDQPFAISTLLPLLENMGFQVVNEQPYHCTLPNPAAAPVQVFFQDFTLNVPAAQQAEIMARETDIQNAFLHILSGQLSNDPFNKILTSANLAWREVWLLRACSRYLLQARLPYSQKYVTDTLDKHADVASSFIKLFHLRFNPNHAGKMPRDRDVAALTAKIEERLSAIASSDEDYILRRLFNVIQSMLRTNFFQRDAQGNYKPYVSFKLDSQHITDLPAPRPLYEVYVYSTRVEAIHLRTSKIARGGIRWSDRREDYRDEVLGLMKAQNVKNTVIVPTGAKGGFYCKQAPSDPKARQVEGAECYKILIRGLLDITDNWTPQGIVKPADVICHDDDDIYVVAAPDKGTAGFSDIANELSREYGFWMEDAFASSGSHGYDHKTMAITARGAWESVMQHFHELGKDIQAEDFTVVGIGDMGGDVFGNGMLLSPHIKLVGAVNYKSIFCDPSPDVKVSFQERQRLFDDVLAWEHYNPKLLSKGGAVFDRTAKDLKLTPEIKASFHLDKDVVTPNELIRAILKSNAELLWFGGIGTYVRSSHETDAEVRDKANDALRITADELQCKVIGEGANLGMTQQSRIAAAQRGILLNTDFIDNSGGVNCSDYEVNIKILLNNIVRNGGLTLPQRNKLLASMTDDVAELVLENNRAQNLAISIATYMSPPRVEQAQRYIQDLEQSGLLDRALEFLPDDATLAVRARDRMGLTRPEMAVIIAYAKMSLTRYMVKNNVADIPELDGMLLDYFPKQLRQKYQADILDHRLKSHLKAMLLSNLMINRLGPLLLKWLIDRTGQEYTDIVKAFIICAAVFKFDETWEQVEQLKGKVAANLQYDLFIDLIQMMDRVIPAMLARPKWLNDMPGAIAHLSPYYETLAKNITKTMPPERKRVHDWHIKSLREQGVPSALALRISDLRSLSSAFAIIKVADDTKQSVLYAAETFFAVGEHLSLDWLREQARQAKATDYWERQAYSTLVEDFIAHQERLTTQILSKSAGKTDGDAIELWTANNPITMKRLQKLTADIRASSQISVPQLMVANRRLRGYIPAKR